MEVSGLAELHPAFQRGTRADDRGPSVFKADNWVLQT